MTVFTPPKHHPRYERATEYCQFLAVLFGLLLTWSSNADTLFPPGSPPRVPDTTFTNRDPSSHTGYSTTVNPRSQWGAWDGWGVSLAWWANVFGDRDDLADIVFTTNYTRLNGMLLPGLGLNIARYNVGGCSSNSVDGAVMQVSPRIRPYQQIQGFWLDGHSTNPASASWNWTVDANQRSMLLKAKARGANLLDLFSDTPMWWMCKNHNPSGADPGSQDNLPPANYDRHAIYLATVAKYAQDHWGITFNSVEAFNEPGSDWWVATGTQEGCHFDPRTQATVIGDLRRELDRRGLTAVNVAASDENTYDQARSTWNSFSASVKAQVGRVNTHGYQYGRPGRLALYSAVGGKKLWDSEYGENDATGLSLARNLNLDFHELHPTAWCYWQAADGLNWGLIRSNPTKHWIGTANRKYFVLAQYSRHIRPGMTIIDGGESNTIAAYDPTARKLVLVTVNYEKPQWITYNLTRFAGAAGPVQSWITATGIGPTYQHNTNVTVNQRLVRAWFPANTIQTFEIQNVDLDPPATPPNLSTRP
jgi:galactan endo-1,6-beta-galactosidase